MDKFDLVKYSGDKSIVSNTHTFGKVFESSVKYEIVDVNHCSFNYQINDDVFINMSEFDKHADDNGFIDVEYSEIIEESAKPYYAIAAASGVLTGTLSLFDLSVEKLEKIDEWKDKDWSQLVVAAAKAVGYKKDDKKGALEFLISRAVPYVENKFDLDFSDGIKVLLNELSAHPSLAGLAFSILTQFSEEKYFFEKSEVKHKKVEKYYAIGTNSVEKIVYGLLYWVFNLAVDNVFTKLNIFENLGLPKELVQIIKEICHLPAFEKIPTNYEEAEKLYSLWIEKLFRNKRENDEEGEKESFDLFTTIKNNAERVIDDSVPVLLNECIVRGFYFLKKLSVCSKEKGLSSIDEFDKIDAREILPFNNRIVSRMSLIASATFVGVNVAGAALKAIKDKKVDKRKFKDAFLTEVNIAGVGKFIFACVADSKYWSDDIKVLFERVRKSTQKGTTTVEDDTEEKDYEESFNMLSLDALQTRILYSIKALSVIKDIEHTEDDDKRKLKQEWFENWKKQIVFGFGQGDEKYLVLNEKILYSGIYELTTKTDENKWFYLLTMELILFSPYFPLGHPNDKKYRKLKICYDYNRDVFVRKQTVVSQDDVDSIKKLYKKSKDLVTGTTQDRVIKIGVTALTTAATTGLALAFAPAIAVAIAGEAVAGLHGAALTGASLAFVGGGSLAAGGFGMAGGTAIITGGGALLGLVSSGGTSMLTILSQTTSEYWAKQCAKILTYGKEVLANKYRDIEAVKQLKTGLVKADEKMRVEIEELDEEKNDLENENLKKLKECAKYVERTISELEKVIKDKKGNA